MNFYSIVAVFFLVFYLAIGLYVSRNLKSLDEYYVMGRNAPAYLITGTLIATNISSVALIGYTGSVYSIGPLPYVAFFGATITCSLILGFYIGRYLWRLNLYTVPDYFATRFPNKGVRIASTAIVLFSMVLYLISVMMGTNVVVHQIFGWSTTFSLVITLGVITIFTMAGGMKGVVVTDTIMFCVFFVAALLLAPYIFANAGGWPDALKIASEKLPHFTKWTGTNTPFQAFWFILETNVMSMILVMASPQLLSRVYIAKSEKTLARAMVLQGLLVPVFVFGLLYVFGLVPLIVSGIDDVNVFPWVATNLVPKFIGAVALSGVVAAALSSASSLFQQAAAALSRDIYQTYLNPNASEDKLLMVSRLSVLVIAIVIFIGAITPQIGAATIVYAFLFATAAWAAWFPALVFGVLWRKASTAAALWSMSIGFLATLVVGFGRTLGFTPNWLPPNIVGLVTSTVIFIIVALFTESSPEEQAVFDRMRQPMVSK